MAGFNLDFVNQIREKMHRHGTMLAYKGFFSHDISKNLLAGTEKKLALEGVDSTIKKKVFNIMMECLQNICIRKESYHSSLFMVGKVNEDFVLHSGNIIKKEDVLSLKNKLVAINSMDKDELKEHFISLITSNRLTDDGRAVLGLIDIAKKSGNKLDFYFEDIDSEDSYFSLRTTINPIQKSPKSTPRLFNNIQAPISYVCELYRMMNQNRILLVYKGDFTHEIIKIVLAMTERKFDTEKVNPSLKKKVYKVMVESLQNIYKHQYFPENPDQFPSVFMIGQNENDGVSVISGNVIENKKIPDLKSRLERINSLDYEGLKQLYKEVRLRADISKGGGAGLGFIDMARKSGNQLIFSFEKINEHISFFSLMSVVSAHFPETKISLNKP